MPALCVVAGCSGGGGSSTGPSMPHATPSPVTSASATPVPSSTPVAGSVSVTVRIDDPASGSSLGHATGNARRNPRYVSPATQSITISVNGEPTVAQNLSPTAPNCTTSSSGYPVCTLTVSALPGSDTFTFVTYDGPSGTGNKLSENTAVATIASSGSNTVAVTLDGIPQSVLVAPYPGQPNVSQQGTGYVLTGTSSANFVVVALDADGNLIVGPGAPALTVTSSSASMTVAPVAGSPNKFTLTPVTEGSSANLNVSVSNPGGSAVTSSTAFAFVAPTPTSLPVSLYLYESPVSGSAGEIDAFPPGSVNNATPTRLTSTWLSNNGGLVAADTNGTIFASGTDTGGNEYSVVSFAASAIGLNASATTAIIGQYKGGPFENALAMAVGPSHNLYVNAQLSDNTFGIFVLQPTATGTASGQYQEIAGNATEIIASNGSPTGIAVDPSGYIYIGMNLPGGAPSILVFAPGAYGNVAPARVISGSNVSFQEPVPIGTSADGTLYVLDYGSAVVYVFPPGANGNVTPERAFESPEMPYHGPMAVDPNGNVYALNEVNTTGVYPVIVFGASASGLVSPLFSISGSNTRIDEPNGMAVSP